MAEEKRIRMVASVAGDAFSYDPGDELVVGKDIPEGLAVAFCSFPEGEPRAVALGWDPTGTVEDDEVDEDEVAESGEDEAADGGEQVERASDPRVESRETATPRRRRGAGKPQPPAGDQA